MINLKQTHCPNCHGKIGYFDKFIASVYACPDCGWLALDHEQTSKPVSTLMAAEMWLYILSATQCAVRAELKVLMSQSQQPEMKMLGKLPPGQVIDNVDTILN